MLYSDYSGDSYRRSRSGDNDSEEESNVNNEQKENNELVFPLNKPIKIKAISNDGDKYLSCHRYYPKDVINSNITKLILEKRELEGQLFNIASKFKDIYQIEFSTDDYNMKNWVFCLNSDNNETNVCLTNKIGNGLFIIKKEGTEHFYLKDILTDSYLNENEENKRDNYSNYLIMQKVPKTEWEFI